MKDQIFHRVQESINESTEDYQLLKYNEALVKTEKAYSIILNHSPSADISKKKIIFNLATLYALQDKFELSKSYLDLVQNSSIQYARKHDMGLIYYFIATQIKKTDIRLECFNSAAENFSKAKDWIKFCHVEIAHAQLLNELGMFKQVEYVTENILRACFCLSDKYQLVKVYCNLATVCAKNTNNIIKIEQAKNLLYKALKTIDNNMKKMHLVEICIHLNLSAILNQLLNYSESIHNIELAYEKLKKIDSKKNMFLSDLKFNEAYARANLGETTTAISVFYESYKYGLIANKKSVWKSLEAIGTLYSVDEKYLLANNFFVKAMEYYAAYSSVYGKNLMIESRLNAKKNTSLNHSKSIKSESKKSLKSDENFESIIEIDEKGMEVVNENNKNIKEFSKRLSIKDQYKSLMLKNKLLSEEKKSGEEELSIKESLSNPESLKSSNEKLQHCEEMVNDYKKEEHSNQENAFVVDTESLKSSNEKLQNCEEIVEDYKKEEQNDQEKIFCSEEEKKEILKDKSDNLEEDFNKEINTLNQDYIGIMRNCENLLKMNEHDTLSDELSNEIYNKSISDEQRNMVRRSIQLMKGDDEIVKLPFRTLDTNEVNTYNEKIEYIPYEHTDVANNMNEIDKNKKKLGRSSKVCNIS